MNLKMLLLNLILIGTMYYHQLDQFLQLILLQNYWIRLIHELYYVNNLRLNIYLAFMRIEIPNEKNTENLCNHHPWPYWAPKAITLNDLMDLILKYVKLIFSKVYSVLFGTKIILRVTQAMVYDTFLVQSKYDLHLIHEQSVQHDHSLFVFLIPLWQVK